MLSVIPLVGSTQIVTNKKPKAPMKSSFVADTSSQMGIYLHYGYGSSFRTLKPNTTDFGKELGARSEEKPIFVSSIQAGAISKINTHLSWDFGILWLQFGEQYHQTFGDSISNYTSTYTHIAVPIRIHFSYGKRLSWFCATGLQGQMLSKYKKEIAIEIPGQSISSTEKNLKYANSFHVSSTTSTGIKYQLGPHIQFLLAGEFIFQLSNTYNKQNAYIHHPYLIQGKVGIQWNW